MDIRIGIINAPREVTIEMAETTTIAEVKATIDEAVSSGAGLVWLTDRKGRETGFPPAAIAYVELGVGSDQRIGFS